MSKKSKLSHWASIWISGLLHARLLAISTNSLDPNLSGIWRNNLDLTSAFFSLNDDWYYYCCYYTQYKIPQLAPDGNYCPTNIVGDMNGDSLINVLDVVVLLNCVLAANCSSFDNSIGDINNDGLWDVIDIVALINIILSN